MTASVVSASLLSAVFCLAPKSHNSAVGSSLSKKHFYGFLASLGSLLLLFVDCYSPIFSLDILNFAWLGQQCFSITHLRQNTISSYKMFFKIQITKHTVMYTSVSKFSISCVYINSTIFYARIIEINIFTAAKQYVTKRLIWHYTRFPLKCFCRMTLAMALHSMCVGSFHCKLGLFTRLYFKKYFRNSTSSFAKAKYYY